MLSMDSPDFDSTTMAGGKDLLNDKNSCNDAVKRGSKLKPPSKIAITTMKTTVTTTKQSGPASLKYTNSPRPSANDRLSQHRMSHSSVNSQRPTSPPSHNKRHLLAPRTTPRQAMIGSGQTATSNKSPVAQLRRNYDTLKLKYDANEQRVSEQQAELELLKKQLEQTDPPLTPPPTLLNKQTTTKLNMDLEEALLEKTQSMEQELAELRQKLDDTHLNTNIPNTPLAEQDQNQTLALKQAVAQVEELKVQNEAYLSQLATKDKELQNLQNQTKPPNTLSYTHTPSDALHQLQKQLDDQKRHYEAILQQHELTILEKDRLFDEQSHILATLKETHDDDIRKLKTDQSSRILKLQQQHKQEMTRLQQKMDAEKAEPEDRQQYLEIELEKIVHAFEQTEHSHTSPYIAQVNLPSGLETLGKDRLKTLGASQGYTSTRYLPTQAVSWPEPQPLSILRKTLGPYSHQTARVPLLDPSDPNKVQIYLSSVSGNPIIKKNQDHIQQLLSSHHIAFESVDVAASETVLQYMKRSNGPSRELPQLFVGGEFRGLYMDVVKHVDEGTLDLLLTPRQPIDALSSSSSSSSSSSASSLLPLTNHLTDEDEALLKDLQREFGQGNIDLSQLDHL